MGAVHIRNVSKSYPIYAPDKAPPGYLEFRMATSEHDSATAVRAAAKTGSAR